MTLGGTSRASSLPWCMQPETRNERPSWKALSRQPYPVAYTQHHRAQERWRSQAFPNLAGTAQAVPELPRKQAVTRDQLISEIRKELGVNERLSNLIKDYGKLFADTALRTTFTTNDAAMLIRQSGMAEGVERFIKDITVAPRAAHDDRPE